MKALTKNVIQTALDGVDFEPFLRTLLHGPRPRVDRVVVVADGDSGAGEARRATYEAAFGEAVAAGRLKVEVVWLAESALLSRSAAVRHFDSQARVRVDGVVGVPGD